jgi:hypothetical protein
MERMGILKWQALTGDGEATGQAPRGERYKARQEVNRMGCLFAMFSGLFPRLALFIIWEARPVLVDAAFNTFLIPLLGIIFLPFATLIYVILYTPGIGLTGWGWFWVILAALFDIGHWGASYTQRNQIPGARGA